ncbi:UPF0182 family membrane protein [Coleofasciculus sp. E2-BRE-01]|uniref:UPF0182 family membrane protein n=1 Tax=Coleofasciculus sp. E2-BRE-01 TaxID=3069524 RepID=UPI0032FC50DD
MKSANKIIIGFLLVVILGLPFSHTLVHILTEAWWFNSVNFSDVFWTRITWKIIAWVGTFIIYGLFLWFNYWMAQRLTRDRAFRFLDGSDLAPYTDSIANSAVLVAIFLISLAAATSSASAWETILKYLNATEFNLTDPIYQQDIGFYLFQFPFYEGLKDWVLTLLGWGFVLAVAVYVLKGKIRLDRYWQHFLTKDVKTHLSLLLAGIALVIAIGFWLERYELLFTGDGVVYGAGYTDAHAQRLAFWIMSIVSLLLGLSFILAIWQNNITLPTYGIGIYLIAFFVFSGLFPWFQQRFIVEPNELEKEKPYIEHNIAYTRKAYDLDEVPTQDYPAEEQLSRQALQENQSTIRNIRLWDYRPLLSTYRQLQEIRLYYRFKDVDVDRYTIDENYRQVMLSPRELVYSQVPDRAQTWVNERLKYTHGYGLVMSPVNIVTEDGLPELFIKDIPPISQVDLQVDESAIYYGEETDTYIFTGTNTQEFDYPRGDENAFTTYAGKGGVPIPSLWQRLAYAYDLGDLKILISNYFINTSRIHYHRQIGERVNQVAPFLRFDKDPYITLIDGRLQWIIDAYTISDRYPYSEPVSQSNNASAIVQGDDIAQMSLGDINYIRNSVKVVVDAFNGTMQFVVVDEDDPVLQTYRKIFPTLFTAQNEIPADVKAHFRYPLDLFTIQAQMYLSYHMNNPQVFYNREDLWRFPTEIYQGDERIMEPYYVIMRLPEASSEEFILILPFTPVNKDNMIAWMAARSDGENYGKLLLYEFPKQELVYGPSQIEARIDQNPQISQQLTLWSQEGSRVIRGDLLVIPIDQSLLYVEPVYLRAEQGELPELKRVIVAYAKEVVMEETLEEALATIFGGTQADVQQPTSTLPSAPPKEGVSKLAQSALETYQKAQEAMRQGNWQKYGQYQQELESILQQLNQTPKSAPDLRKSAGDQN